MNNCVVVFESDKREAELQKEAGVLMSLILRTQHCHEYLSARVCDEGARRQVKNETPAAAASARRARRVSTVSEDGLRIDLHQLNKSRITMWMDLKAEANTANVMLK